MRDIEDSLGRAWNPLLRPLVAEAWRCYNAGAVRASIAATWTAVTADLIDKIIALADDGDGDAQKFRKQIDAARAKGISTDGVREMQAVEARLLDEAARLELIDSIGSRELARIREDRHLCVHPSLRHLGEVYEPRPEVARAHLAVALETLLTHPPTQGRKALEQFVTYACDPLFSATPAYIQAVYFDHVRAATRRNLIDIAAKHALCELPIPAEYSATETVVADRMAASLKAFASRDRDLVRTTMASLVDRFRRVDSEVQVRALGRLGDQDYFWDMLDQPLVDRLDDLVSRSTHGTEPWASLPGDVATMLAIVREPIARTRLPSLESLFEKLQPAHRAQVAAVSPAPYFARRIDDLLASAHSYRAAEDIGYTIVVPHGPYYSLEMLEEVLDAWKQNDQCRVASGMLIVAEQLLAATDHLGVERYSVFREFVDTVKAIEPKGSQYTYHELDEALLTSGH
ncbi:hypothetical protein SAMN05421805_102242 [Saccharopolyspora antimicrobica]|uniref:Uncharacterized protein n=1 Tax=Saccharopolyspora antimicrobica TaxID=455193 RepID=A0A1I4VK54_9PSEU|nr:hypothetical protein [Saccharopolyspora antimicrobica]RKT86346.1 hypothetical protein ATL45_4711 [Saccharopolyspora antimicrobica]SFN01406.1 hypothetical protein SAMN05421805_102242 [Saccharopolyspora antimicrobica]